MNNAHKDLKTSQRLSQVRPRVATISRRGSDLITLLLADRIPKGSRRTQLGIMVLILWGLIVTAGFMKIVTYSQTRGLKSLPSSIIKLASFSQYNQEAWQLVIGIHPKCSCSQATAAELEQLLLLARNAGNKISCTVLVYSPTAVTEDWVNTSLVNTFRNIPNVNVELDPGGVSLVQFGILTSGGVVLYDKHGLVRFHGGITIARGHEGNNLGVETILAILDGRQTLVNTTPIYGCPIHDLEESSL